MDGSRVRCLVADDHEALRAGIAWCIQDSAEMEIAGQAADAPTAIALIERRRPHVAIVDVHMPGGGGLEVCRAVQEAGWDTAVLLYTGDRDAELLQTSLQAGARGFVLKAGPLSEVVRAARLVASGETYVDPTLVTGLMELSKPNRPKLSEREGQVLQCLADGLTTDAAAQRLFLSSATIRSYAESAMQKLAASNRTHAVAAALRGGLIG